MAVWGRTELSGCRIVALSRRLLMGTRTDFWCSICRISSRFASHSARVISEFSATAMRRKARQACTQYDTLLLSPAVPQPDVHLHISRMPPSQVRSERRQRLQQVWTLFRYETCAYVDYILAVAISLPTGNFPHRGRRLLQLRVGTHARQVFRRASAPYSELNPITGDQAGIAVTPGGIRMAAAGRSFRGYTSTKHPGRGHVNIVGAQRGFYS
jgi:hypothetical protein